MQKLSSNQGAKSGSFDQTDDDYITAEKFNSLCTLADKMELLDHSTGKILSKHASYKRLSRLMLMPVYSSRCVSHSFLKFLSYVPNTFQVSLVEWENHIKKPPKGAPKFDPTAELKKTIPQVILSLSGHRGIRKRN
jgi:hypothetical protein